MKKETACSKTRAQAGQTLAKETPRRYRPGRKRDDEIMEREKGIDDDLMIFWSVEDLKRNNNRKWHK